MKYQSIILATTLFIAHLESSFATEVSLTFDDFNIDEAVMLTAEERNKKILQTLDDHQIQAALFVQAKYIDSARGKTLLKEWNDKGHQIGNHTYSHLSYNSQNVNFHQFSQDFLKAENLLSDWSCFQKIFRFPYLHEGNTQEKRDQFRSFLKYHHYKIGHVTIDTSDWYINDRLIETLIKNPKKDLSGYRDYFLNHIWDHANFYHELSKKTLGKEVKHTLLLHYNLLNALYLKDIIAMFQDQGWTVIASSEAFQDPVFKKEPQLLPSGNSLIWSLARETGKFESLLRNPGEDGDYEKALMDQLGL